MGKTDDFTINRRSLLATAVTGAAGTALGAALPVAISVGMSRPAAAQTTQITVADPGGPYSPAFRKAFYDPFEKATGIKVVNVAREAEPTAQFKAIVETKSYSWDVCTLTLSARDILARQNLLEPLDFPASDAPGLMPEALTGQWMGTDVYSTILAYRTDRFPSNPPQSWADFWNVEKFPGRRSLARTPSTRWSRPCWRTACRWTSFTRWMSSAPTRAWSASARTSPHGGPAAPSPPS